MENNSNNKPLSDVERNKELFEYEMTEVLMQLKGEFADLNSKSVLKNAEGSLFSANKPVLPEKMKEVSEVMPTCPAGSAEIPSIDINTEKVEITVQKSEHDIPETKSASPLELKDVSVEKINCVIPENIPDGGFKVDTVNSDIKPFSDIVVPVTSEMMKGLNVVKTVMTFEKISADIPETPVMSANTSEVDIERFSIPVPDTAFSSLNITAAEVSTEKISVSLPETNVSIAAPEAVSVSEIKADIPEIKPVPELKTGNIEVSAVGTVPEIKTFGSVETNTAIDAVKPVLADSVEIPAVPVIEKHDIAVQKMNIENISVPEISVKTPSVEPSVKNISVNMSDIKDISITVPAEINAERTGAGIEYPEVPAINITMPEKKDIVLETPEINIEIKKAVCPETTKIEVKPVPKAVEAFLPDLDAEMKAILESVV